MLGTVTNAMEYSPPALLVVGVVFESDAIVLGHVVETKTTRLSTVPNRLPTLYLYNRQNGFSN